MDAGEALPINSTLNYVSYDTSRETLTDNKKCYRYLGGAFTLGLGYGGMVALFSKATKVSTFAEGAVMGASIVLADHIVTTKLPLNWCKIVTYVGATIFVGALGGVATDLAADDLDNKVSSPFVKSLIFMVPSIGVYYAGKKWIDCMFGPDDDDDDDEPETGDVLFPSQESRATNI